MGNIFYNWLCVSDWVEHCGDEGWESRLPLRLYLALLWLRGCFLLFLIHSTFPHHCIAFFSSGAAVAALLGRVRWPPHHREDAAPFPVFFWMFILCMLVTTHYLPSRSGPFGLRQLVFFWEHVFHFLRCRLPFDYSTTLLFALLLYVAWFRDVLVQSPTCSCLADAKVI